MNCWQGVGMDQRGKCVHGWGFDLRRGMDREVGIRFVSRWDEEMVSRRHGFAAIARWDEGIGSHLALLGSFAVIRG